MLLGSRGAPPPSSIGDLGCHHIDEVIKADEDSC